MESNRLLAHIDKQFIEENPESKKPSTHFSESFKDLEDKSLISGETADILKAFLEQNYSLIDEGNEKEEARYKKLIEQIQFNKKHDEVLGTLGKHIPVFVLHFIQNQ